MFSNELLDPQEDEVPTMNFADWLKAQAPKESRFGTPCPMA